MTVRGTTQTLTATFRKSPGGPLVDPTAVSLSISGPASFTHTASSLAHDGLGLYRYEWAIPLTATPGTYTATWTATLPGNSSASVGYEIIEVTEFAAPNVPDYGGCLWPMDPACTGDTWAGYTADVQHRALALASSTLQRLTGNRVTNCPITIRPASGMCMDRYGYDPFVGGTFLRPLDWAGTWYNVACCSVSSTGLLLPPPATRIDQVKVDGVVLDPSDYALRNNRLYWQGASAAPWLLNQDLSLPDTEVGTFSVTYLNGYPVDALGAYAVGILAQEFAAACTGGHCRLPENVTSVTRQGITMTLDNSAFQSGTTGIREVDSYIALWNPGHLRREATVWSPDLPTYHTGG